MSWGRGHKAINPVRTPKRPGDLVAVELGQELSDGHKLNNDGGDARAYNGPYDKRI
jgi:hypothetical protein